MNDDDGDEDGDDSDDEEGDDYEDGKKGDCNGLFTFISSNPLQADL